MVRRIICLAVVSLMFTTAGGFAAQGLTVFHIGNSLTDETYGVHKVAEGFGHTWNGLVYGRSMIPGCPIHLLWTENMKKTNDQSTGYCGFFMETPKLGDYQEGWITDLYPKLYSTSLYLRAKSYDALVLQVFPDNGDDYSNQGTVAGCLGFSGEAYTGNPNCQVYIYPSHTMDIGKKCDTTEYAKIYEPLAKAITAKYPARKPACVIPVTKVWNKMMEAGYTDLWSDGHANANGKYILIMTFYATIYKKDPAGAITKDWYGTGLSVTPAFAAKAQEIAWSVARSYAMSGVGPVKTAPYTPVATVSNMKTGAQTPVVDLCGRRILANSANNAFVTGSKLQATVRSSTRQQGR